jgi:hypothetical protein
MLRRFLKNLQYVYVSFLTLKKGKADPVLNLLSTTPWRRMGGTDVRTNIFLTSALIWGEWLASRPAAFPPPPPPGKESPSTQWIGGWVGPRAGLDDMEKWKILFTPGLELRPLGRQPVASRSTDCAIPALLWHLMKK